MSLSLIISNISNYPEPGTPLFEKIAIRLADVYNDCGFDAVYFDGSEGTAALGSEQIPISMFEDLFFRKLTRDILVEGSSIVPYVDFLLFFFTIVLFILSHNYCGAES